MKDNEKKILIRLQNGSRELVHFCYIPDTLYNDFFSAVWIQAVDIYKYIQLWSYKDFGKRPGFLTKEGVQWFKDFLTQEYILRCVVPGELEKPEINAAPRAWLCNHMRKYLEELEKEGG